MIRVGFGFDTHRLKEGLRLCIGGIEIPYHLGCEGHSDADVLIHAICDALFGAASLPDIGRHFPDADLQYKGIDSKILLKETYQIITQQGWKIGNIDTTVVLEKPKLASYIPQMREVLAQVLQIEIERISIKAKTSEGLGFAGRHEGVSAYAIALLCQTPLTQGVV